MGKALTHDGLTREELMSLEPEGYANVFDALKKRVGDELQGDGWDASQGWDPKEYMFRADDDPRAVNDLVNGLIVMGWGIRQERKPEGLVYIFESIPGVSSVAEASRRRSESDD